MAIDLRDQRRRQGVTVSLPRVNPVVPQAPQRSANQGTRMAPVPTPTPDQMPGQDQGGGSSGRGLGFLINNPVTRNALKPLEVLDLPRRASILGFEQAAKLLPQEAEYILAATSMGLLAPMLAIDEEKVGQDTRSNWDKFTDPTYGFGQVTGDTGNKWLDRGVGLAGDILLDPMTYATFGTGAAVKGVATSGRAARMERVAEAARTLQKSGQLDDATVEALRGVVNKGYSAAKTPELRAALQVERPGLRFQLPFSSRTTPRVPGTQTLAKAVNTPIDATRGAFNRSATGRRIMDTRTPKGLEEATHILAGRQGNQDDFIAAINRFGYDQAQRQGSGRFKALGAAELKQRSQAIRDEIDNSFGGNLNEYLRATEVGDVETELNRLSARMVEIGESLGVEVPEISGIDYLPHMLSPEFKALLDNGTPEAEAFMSAAGIRTVDTLRDSGFLSARAFKPDPEGVRKPIRIGNKELRITEGSIAEINEKVAELFPQLKTTALETDPMTLFEKYIEGVAEDIGNRYANKVMADGGGIGSRGVNRIDNISGESRTVRHGEDAFADNEFFKGVKDEDATDALHSRIASSAEETIDKNRGSIAYPELGGADVLRWQVAEEASDFRNQSVKGLRDSRSAYSTRIRETADRMAAISQEVKGARAQQRAVIEVANKEARSLSAQAAAITRKMKVIPGQVKASASAARRQVVDDAFSKLEQLRREAEDLNDLIARYTTDTIAVEEVRRQTNDALKAAQKAYDDAVQALRQDPLVRPVRMTPKPDTSDIELAQVELRGLKSAIQGVDPKDPRYKGIADAIAQREQFLKDNADRLPKEAPVERAAETAASAADVPVDVQVMRQAQEELKALTEARAELVNIDIRIRTIADTIADRKQAIATYEQRVDAARKRGLRGVALNKEVGPSPSQLRAANARGQANLTALRNERRKLAKRAVYRDIDDKIAQRRATIQQIQGQLPNAQVVAHEPVEAVDRARRQFIVERAKQGDEVARQRMTDLERGLPVNAPRRIRQVPGELRRAKERLVSEVSMEPGSKVRAINEGIEPEIRYRSALPEYKRQTKLRRAREVKQEALAKSQRIDEEIAGSYDEYRKLMDDDQALRAQRYEVQKALNAAPPGRDPLTRLVRTGKGGDDFWPDETFGLRPDRGEAAKTLAAASPTEAGLHRVQPLNSSLDDIEELVRLNPNMDDEALRQAEALLHRWRTMLDNASTMDMKANQAQRVIQSANKGEIVDVVVAQLDHAKWKLMPEGDIVMAQELARLFKNVAATRENPRLLGQTLTAFTNFFKTYATLSPGFHVRNAISAVFMNSADGVPMGRTLTGAKKWQQFLAAKDPLAYFDALDDDWKRAFDAVFGTGAGGRFLEKGVAESTMIGRTRLKEGIYRNRATVWSQRQGERVEGAVRLGMAYDTIKNGGTVNDAINRVSRIHFDYSQVSEFDESAKRLIPFWTFMSRNLPMQLTQMWMKPRRYLQYQSFVRNFSSEPDAFTPEYILNAGGFDTGLETPEGLPGSDAGMPIFLQPDLAHTRITEDVERLLNVRENPAGVLSDFNPFFTAPIEYATGKDLFTGRVYEQDDYRPTGGVVDTALLPIMALLGQTKTNSQGDVFYQEKGVDALRSLIPVLDRVSRLAPQTVGESGGDRQLESLLRFAGLPVRTVSDDQRLNERRSRYYDLLDERDLQRVLEGGQ